MSKRCELQKEFFKEHGNYKGTGKYSDKYVSWLEDRVLELSQPTIKSDNTKVIINLEKEIQELRVEVSNFADWLNENFETTINCAWLGKKGIYKGGVYSSSQLRSIYFEALNK